MSSNPAKKTKTQSKVINEDDVVNSINSRRSNELIIAICGAIGSGTTELSEQLKKSLDHNGYAIETIKISKLIFEIRNDPEQLSGIERFERYHRFQDAGNEIREKLGNNYLSKAVIEEIVKRRDNYLDTEKGETKTTKKIAYIVDQLKHPEEMKLLKLIYRQCFYLIGINSTEKDRKLYLLNKAISSKNANKLIERDRKQEEKFGQQVEKTFFLSDFFIHNKGNSESIKDAVIRFIDLAHGVNGKTPTRDEKGVYEAFSVSLQSACLSRQVGAAIVNQEGDIIATGCNDVPAYGGGLYNAEHGSDDHRCVFKGGECSNDLHKKLLKKDFEDILNKRSISDANHIADELLNYSQAKNLIEYSRSIHAEMAALMQLARSSGQSSVGATLYCTTYPCHNCARHIVAAGIERVIYIEPYEKSLALRLHNDAITNQSEKNKVSFEPFQGISPSRYMKFFKASDDRKKDGTATFIATKDSYHADPNFMDSYYDYESRVIDDKSQKKNPFT